MLKLYVCIYVQPEALYGFRNETKGLITRSSSNNTQSLPYSISKRSKRSSCNFSSDGDDRWRKVQYYANFKLRIPDGTARDEKLNELLTPPLHFSASRPTWHPSG